MQVVVMRHGAAVDTDQAGDDARRWLTREGRRNVGGVAAALYEAGLRFDRIFMSPLVRAVQSAEILAGHGAFDGALRVWPSLAQGGTARVLAALEEGAPQETIALVGHSPVLRPAVSRLAGVPASLPMSTSAAILLEWDGQRGSFRWMLDPRTLCRVDSLEGLAPRR